MLSDIAPGWKWVITLGIAGTIVLLSVLPGEGNPDDSLFLWMATGTPKAIKKLIHVVAYASLAASWFWTLAACNSRKTRFLLAFFLAAGLGLVLEVCQVFVPGRYGTVFDAALNAFGASAALFGIAWLQRRSKGDYASRT